MGDRTELTSIQDDVAGLGRVNPAHTHWESNR